VQRRTPAFAFAVEVAFAVVLAVVRSLPLKPKNVISTEAAHSLIVSSAAEKSAVAFAVAFVVVCSLSQTPSFRPKAAHFAAAVEKSAVSFAVACSCNSPVRAI